MALSVLAATLLFPAIVAAGLPRQDEAEVWRHQAAATRAQQSSEQLGVGTAKNIRPERYEIDVAFDPPRSFLRAKATVTLRASEPVAAIEFELNSHLAIREITDEQGRRLAFDRGRLMGSPRLLVRLAEPCAADQELALTFSYDGVLPRRPLDYITPEGLLLRDESRWYPAIDLAAFVNYEFAVTVPTGWAVLAGGQATLRRTEETNVTYRVRPSAPVSSLAIAGVRGVANLRNAEDVFGWLGRLLGGRPQSEYIVAQGFANQPGAIGYSGPGFLIVGQDVVAYHDYPGWSSEFLPHEIAHQWFPIEVTIARQEDGWLAESLAEYLAWRYLLESNPAEARRLVERAMRDSLAPEPLRPIGLGLRLFALEDWEVTHATLYQRGMLVFRTLETVIGRQRVDAALREYYRRFRGRTASIADFRRVCEEIAERDLGWFFAYFLDGTQIPEIEVRRLPSTAPGETSGEIIVRNVPPEFTARVEMRLRTSEGAVEHSVATRGPVTPFTVTTASPVSSILLDPDLRILRWTEAARRHRTQRELLGEAADIVGAHGGTPLPSAEQKEAFALLEQALAADAGDLARDEQLIRFVKARLALQQNQLSSAWAEFSRVVGLESLGAMETDFYRAWARVFRAQIARRQGRAAAARAEAQAALASKSPAMETRVRWPDADKEQSAREALQQFLAAR